MLGQRTTALSKLQASHIPRVGAHFRPNVARSATAVPCALWHRARTSWPTSGLACAANPPAEAAATASPATPLSEEEDFDLLQTKVDVLAKQLAVDLKGTNVYLVGMMGTGKTTVGRLLAYCLGYCFFDTDEVIQTHNQGQTVASIFEDVGEAYFRTIESEVRTTCDALPLQDGSIRLASFGIVQFCTRAELTELTAGGQACCWGVAQ